MANEQGAKSKLPKVSQRQARREVIRAVEGDPDFITKAELAFHLCVTTQTIDGYIKVGTFPPPHSRLGTQSKVWRRRDYKHFLEHKTWPQAAFDPPKRRA